MSMMTDARDRIMVMMAVLKAREGRSVGQVEAEAEDHGDDDR